MSFWYQLVPWDIGGKNLVAWIDFLDQYTISQANLTHHIPGKVELELVCTIPSNLTWTVHLSSKTLGTIPLKDFIDTCNNLPRLRELLVVSGNPKPKRTSLNLLQELSRTPTTFPLAVAASAKDSDELLSSKLQYPCVTRVYLQLAEPEQWQVLTARIRSLRSNILLSACWLPPTLGNWQALRLFPWSGSSLSDNWKDSQDYAKECAQRQLDWMKANDVTPLIEPRRITASLIDTINNYHL